MGRVERQQRAREEMQTLIRQAAMKLFLENGFEETSIRSIADEIGYTPGAIYSYFKDKDAILFSLHEEGFEKLIALQMSTLEIEDPYERLVKCGELYLQFALENTQYYELMFISKSTAKKILEHEEWEHGHRSYDFLRALVQACMEKNEIPTHDLEGAAFAFWSAVHGIAALVIRGRCPMIPEEDLPHVLRSALEFWLRSVRRPAT
jgi:AcrR family transcriptional regulator